MTDTTVQIIDNYKFSCCDSILPNKKWKCYYALLIHNSFS